MARTGRNLSISTIDLSAKPDVNDKMIKDKPNPGIRSIRAARGISKLLVWVSVAVIAGAASATDFQSLAKQGYRWVIVNGPYACPKKEDAQKLAGTKNVSSDLELQDRTHAYFLLPGMIVLVLENDASSGLSRIRASGLVVDLWAPTRYLTSQPIKDTYGVTETPDSAGLGQVGISPSPSPPGSGTLMQGSTPAPDASASPMPNVSVTPGESPLPDVGASPSPSPQ
jgi:hypothetical protein